MIGNDHDADADVGANADVGSDIECGETMNWTHVAQHIMIH